MSPSPILTPRQDLGFRAEPVSATRETRDQSPVRDRR